MRGRGGSGSGGGGGGSSGNRKGPNPLTRSYESTGPDVKVRGTALHIAEKYVQLARDAQSSGDRVLAENYLQHAEHYYRLIAAAQAQLQQPIQIVRSDIQEDDDAYDDDVDTTADVRPVAAAYLDAPQPFVDEQPGAPGRQPQPGGERPTHQGRDRDHRDMRGDRENRRERDDVREGRPEREGRDRFNDRQRNGRPPYRPDQQRADRFERGDRPGGERFEPRDHRPDRRPENGFEPRGEYRGERQGEPRPERFQQDHRPERPAEARPETRPEPRIERQAEFEVRQPEPVAVEPALVADLPAFITGAPRGDAEPVRKRRVTTRTPRARKATGEDAAAEAPDTPAAADE